MSISPEPHSSPLPSPPPDYHCLQDVLRHRAASNWTGNLVLYPSGSKGNPTVVSYQKLQEQAAACSQVIARLEGFQEGSPVLLHLTDHLDALVWFWGVLLADGVPVQSSPLSNNDEHRRRHLSHLSSLLESPICITRLDSLSQFDGEHQLQIHTLESLAARITKEAPSYIRPDAGYIRNATPDSLAMLMLTSGSTGAPKAVRLTHKQVLAAVEGKSSLRNRTPGGSFLNWIGLDHVASLVEIHIQALYLGVDQVHVQAADIVSNPTTFLDLLSRHAVVTSFAPNFFLAKLVSAVKEIEVSSLPNWDLSALTVLASGGEANDMSTCISAAEIFARYGAPDNVLMPGFGMTETCAGCIFNTSCPAYDVKQAHSFASLGHCMPGVAMRVLVPEDEDNPQYSDSVELAKAGQLGDLQVRGEVVFGGYYRNPQATYEALTCDGWFRTGDQALIDANGTLCLKGRAKDTMNINGVSVSGDQVQTAIDQALHSRVSRAVAFPSRAPGAPTEQVTVAYVPHLGDHADPSEHASKSEELIDEAVMLCTGSRPMVFSLPNEGHLPVTALGKISRKKMRTLYETGTFDAFAESHRITVDAYRASHTEVLDTSPPNKFEALLLSDLASVLDTTIEIDVNTPVWDLGCTSMDMIKLKKYVSDRTGKTVPITTMIKNPTVRSLAKALGNIHSPCAEMAKSSYDPVLTLNATGSKPPLWLFHPGVGEVLVFVGLAQQLADTDRPIYALRARGFDAGEPQFESIEETVATYHAAIRRIQPEGPYALAGYSYGSMLAFEVAKVLERQESEVRFLGCLNLPPYIGTRMAQLTWPLCLLHLAHFLGLCSEEYVDRVESAGQLRDASHAEAMRTVLSAADNGRLEELGLNESSLANWTNVAYGLQRMAVGYQPRGNVAALDVFHAIPLKAVGAASRQDWVDNHLGRWREFCRTDVAFHDVGGAHYTMIDPDHVKDFASKFKAVLRQREL